jgi:hypothetical protein
VILLQTEARPYRHCAIETRSERFLVTRVLEEAIVRARSGSLFVLTVGIYLGGCSGSDGGSDTGTSQGAGSAGSLGGAANSSSVPATGGAPRSSGNSSSGGVSSTSTSRPSLGGSTGSSMASGGSLVGGSTAAGGSSATGSTKAAGGSSATGSTKAAGGSTASGGTKAAGGSTATGSSGAISGFIGTGGSKAAGGAMSSAGGGTVAGGASPGAAGTSSSGGGTHATGGTSSAAGVASTAGAGDAVPSSGCGKTSALKNSASTTTFNYNTATISGKSRQYILRLPQDYDDNHPYRLILGFHGATGKGSDVAGNPAYFGLYDLSKGSTVFIAPSADGGIWSATTDLTFVDEILKQVEADVCIDTSRIELEGFSQGGAMVFTLACSRPGVFRAAVVHSGGGLSKPTSCTKPIAYLSSLGAQEDQSTQTSDFFAKTDGCTGGAVSSFSKVPTGGHLCSDYTGCSAGYPVRWCPYDGGHTPSPSDSGQSSSWMPKEVWAFLSQF